MFAPQQMTLPGSLNPHIKSAKSLAISTPNPPPLSRQQKPPGAEKGVGVGGAAGGPSDGQLH